MGWEKLLHHLFLVDLHWFNEYDTFTQNLEYQLKFSFTDISTHITGRSKDNVLEPLLTSFASVCNDRGAMSDCVPTEIKKHELVFREIINFTNLKSSHRNSTLWKTLTFQTSLCPLFYIIHGIIVQVLDSVWSEWCEGSNWNFYRYYGLQPGVGSNFGRGWRAYNNTGLWYKVKWNCEKAVFYFKNLFLQQHKSKGFWLYVCLIFLKYCQLQPFQLLCEEYKHTNMICIFTSDFL